MIVLIVTPTFNAGHFLDETVLSIVSQVGEVDLYYHIQDSQSKDNTLEIIQKWNNILVDADKTFVRTNFKFSWASEKDDGMYDAINRGFAHLLRQLPDGTPDRVIMGWVNGNDILTQGAVQTVQKFFQETDYQWVTGVPCQIRSDSATIHLEGEPWGFCSRLLAQGFYDDRHYPFVQQEGTFWRQNLWDVAGPLDTRLQLAADWDLWRRFASISEIVALRAVLGQHRRHPGQMSSRLGAYLEEVDRVNSSNATVPSTTTSQEYCTLIGSWDSGVSRWVIEKRAMSGPMSLKDTIPMQVQLRDNLLSSLKTLKAALKKKYGALEYALGSITPDIIVSHCEVNDRQGVGILLQRIFQDSSNIVSIRSQDLYGGKQDFGCYNLCIGHGDNSSRQETLKTFSKIFRNRKPRYILSTPYFKDDVLSSIAIKDLFGAPLCTYLMDDQNIYANNIPDHLIDELLSKSDLCLGISRELCEAYKEKFGYKFWFLPAVVSSDILQTKPTPPHSYGEGLNVGVLIGNIWSQQWLEQLRELTRATGQTIHWYGNPNREWIKFSEKELKADGILFQGYIPEDQLVNVLRKAKFGVVLTGTTDDQKDRPELARLSLPSRLTYLIAVANLPIIVVGNRDAAAAKFVIDMDLGQVCSYQSEEFEAAVHTITLAERQTDIRKRAANLAVDLSAQDIDSWIWLSLAQGKPINYRFEQLGTVLTDSSAILTAIELNQRHGTGPLVKRIVDGTPNILSIRSMDIYQGEHDFGDLSLLVSHTGLSRSEAEKNLVQRVGNNTVKQVLCIPYRDDDLISSIKLSEWQKAPLGTYIMDDQNICVNNIPDELMHEFLSKCSLRLATHPELREAYENKYQLKFWLLPAVVPDHLITNIPEAPQTTPSWASKGALIGSLWSKQWYDMLSKAVMGAQITIDWFGNTQYPWMTLIPEETKKQGINLCGLLPEIELVSHLKRYPYIIVPTGTLDERDDRQELTKLSLPGRIIFVLATSNTPIIVMGNKTTPAARFVERFGVGVHCDYDGESLRKAVEWVSSPAIQSQMRRNAAFVSKRFSAKGLNQWLWSSIKLGKPIDTRFEDLFAHPFGNEHEELTEV